MELRPYQEQARQAIEKEWSSGVKNTLLVLPTGCGKTVVFSKVIEDQVKEGKRVLVMAHRGELLDQAADKLHKMTGLTCAVEKADQSCLGTWNRVVVGSVQSLMRPSRLAKFNKDYFDAIIVDEAHHAVSDTYTRVLEHFNQANVLGVTATPERSDMRKLGSLFQSLAYEYSIVQAIKEGYLCKIKAQTVPLKIDMNSVSVTAGDFSANEIGTALDPYLEQIATEMETVCKNRKTVVFLPLIATSQKFKNILINHGFKAAEVNGNSDDREQILKDFSDNKYNVICNSMLLTEGWDCPDVDCIVVLRPTKVRSLYCQMVGRGTRLCKNLFGIDKHKQQFYIFDCCRNFEFFEENARGIETQNVQSLTEKIYNLKLDLIVGLENMNYQSQEEYKNYREELVEEFLKKITELNKNSFIVRNKVVYIDKFSNIDNWKHIDNISYVEIRENIIPILLSEDSDELAKRFDNLVYGLQVGRITGKNTSVQERILVELVEDLKKLGTIPEVVSEKELIEKASELEYWERTDFFEIEKTRTILRELMKYIDNPPKGIYNVDIIDELKVSEKKEGYNIQER